MMTNRTYAPLLFLPLVLAAGSVSGAVLDGVSLHERSQPISILSEEGVIVPPIELLDLGREAEIKIEIQTGPAVFILDGSKEAAKGLSYRDSVVTLPQMLVGFQHGSDSSILISVDGKPVGEPIRVGILRDGGIAALGELPAVAPAIILLDIGARYAVVDEERPDYSAVGGQASLRPIDLEWCPEHTWEEPELDDPPIPSTEVCLASPFGGKVVWDMGDPGQNGAKFSVKPEDAADNVLAWASAPHDYPIDGVYRLLWGCGIALKVPDGCELTSKLTTGKCCCNQITQAFGRECTWIDPRGPLTDWRDCPLGA